MYMHHVSVLYQDWFWGQLEHCKGTVYSHMLQCTSLLLCMINSSRITGLYRQQYTMQMFTHICTSVYVVVYTIHFTLYFTCTVCSTVHVNVHVHNGIVTSIWINTYRYVNFWKRWTLNYMLINFIKRRSVGRSSQRSMRQCYRRN